MGADTGTPLVGVTAGLVEGVPDPVGELVAEVGAVGPRELSGTDVTPDLTVTVDDGKMLITGMVAVSPGPVLLVSINVNDRETDVDDVGG